MAGRNVNRSVSDADQLALFADYHAAIAAHREKSTMMIALRAEVETHGEESPKAIALRTKIEAEARNSPKAIACRNAIFEFNKKLVYRPAKVMAAETGEPEEDFKQVGVIGLIRAIERFDPKRGVRFSSYAMSFIKGDMLHHVRDNPINANPKVRRGDKDLYYAIRKIYRDAVAAKPGEEIDIDTIALGMKKPDGSPALTEYTWMSLQVAMSSGPMAELNEEITAEAVKEDVERLVRGGAFSKLTRKCIVEAVLRQPLDIPYSDRVAIAAKKLKLSVAEVEQRTKMGLSQVQALHELALSQART